MNSLWQLCKRLTSIVLNIRNCYAHVHLYIHVHVYMYALAQSKQSINDDTTVHVCITELECINLSYTPQ